MENTKSFNRKMVIVFVFLSISLLFLGCQKKNEQAPFFDELYLEYYEVFGKPQNSEDPIWTREIEYRFKKLGNGSFHISQKVNTQRGEKLEKTVEPTPYPQVGEDLTIDQKGIVLKDGDNFMNFINGYPAYLWLPPDKRKKGVEIIKGVRIVGDKTESEGREVMSVNGLLGDIHYYDVETGILVGVENLNGKLKMILVDTNHETLKTFLTKSTDY